LRKPAKTFFTLRAVAAASGVVLAFAITCFSQNYQPAGASKATLELIRRARTFSQSLRALEDLDARTGDSPFDPKESNLIRNSTSDPMTLACPEGAKTTCVVMLGSVSSEARYLMEQFRASVVWLRHPCNADCSDLKTRLLPDVTNTWTELREALCADEPQATFPDWLGRTTACQKTK